MVLRSGAAHRIVSVGHLLLLPRSGDWSVSFQRDMRAIVLSVTSDACTAAIAGSRVGASPGHGTGRLRRSFLAHARCGRANLEDLSDSRMGGHRPEPGRSAADLVHQLIRAERRCRRHSATQAAILHRICQTIERRLDDAELSPARASRRPKEFPSATCKSCSRGRRQFYPLCARAAAAAGLGGVVQSGGGASVDIGNRLPLRLQRFRAFQPRLFAIALACRRANSASRRRSARRPP